MQKALHRLCGPSTDFHRSAPTSSDQHRGQPCELWGPASAQRCPVRRGRRWFGPCAFATPINGRTNPSCVTLTPSSRYTSDLRASLKRKKRRRRESRARVGDLRVSQRLRCCILQTWLEEGSQWWLDVAPDGARSSSSRRRKAGMRFWHPLRALLLSHPPQRRGARIDAA